MTVIAENISLVERAREIITPGGRKRKEAREFEAAKQKFTGIITPFTDKLNVLAVNAKIILVESNEQGVSDAKTSTQTRNVVSAERVDNITIKVKVDFANSVYIKGISIGRGDEAGAGFHVERRVIEVDVVNDHNIWVVGEVKSGLRSEYAVKELNWDDVGLAVEPVAVKVAGKTDALNSAVSIFSSKSE